ncbi:MAG: hypothetical protein IIY21_29315 [Clostridiales bacterium]|nr:hypothetical protein [Clostridiales bacterium]MBQ5823964.1 hypothetical protein [Clostridia bacterium]
MKYEIYNKGKSIKFSTKPSQALAAYEDKDGRSCIDIYPIDDISNSYLKIWFNNDSLHIIVCAKKIDIILETSEKIVEEIREALTKAGIEVF